MDERTTASGKVVGPVPFVIDHAGEKGERRRSDLVMGERLMYS